MRKKNRATFFIILVAGVSLVGVFYFGSYTKILKEEKNSLETHKNELEKHVISLRNQNTHIDNANKNLTEKNNALERQVTEMDSINEGLQTEVGVLEDRNAQHMAINEELFTEYFNANVERYELEREYAQPAREKTALAANIEGDIFSLGYEDITELTKATASSSATISYFDETYSYLPVHMWQQVIAVDKTDELEPKIDERDCDNFSQIFKSHINEDFGLNGVGVVLGIVFDVSTEEITQHAWNVVLAQDEDEPALYFLEPQTDVFVKMSNKTILGDKLYIPTDEIIWN